MLGTAVNLAVYKVQGDRNWRLMLGLPCIPAVPLILLIYLCPESPRWLMKRNRYADAWGSLRKLRFNDIQVARDIYYINAQLDIEHQIIGQTNFLQRGVQLFTVYGFVELILPPSRSCLRSSFVGSTSLLSSPPPSSSSPVSVTSKP